MDLPVDFEEKAKIVPAPGGSGYPYRISANDLMRNYKYAALQVDTEEVRGLKLEEVVEGETRFVKLAQGDIQQQSAVTVTWYDGDGERTDDFVIVNTDPNF